MKKLIALVMTAAVAGFSFAADVAQPETPGGEKPKAAAESKHLAKKHGLKKPKQQEAQAAGSEKAQAAAEAKHLKKKHGNVNDSADQRLEKGHPNH
jgi:opacity protein-like surface antigen